MGADSVARRGVLVRHLVMPGMLEESEAIFQWFAQRISRDTYINIMDQYRPAHRVGRRWTTAADEARIRFAEIARPVQREEIGRAYALAREAGLWRFDKRQ